MSIDTPPHYTYFTVTGRYLRRVIDGPDLDRNPDVVASTGSFKFVPKAPEFKDLSIPATFSNVEQTASLDPAGFLVDEQGRPGVVLMSGNSPHISPSGWSWTVTATINGRQFPPFDLPADIQPGATVDLTMVAPAATSGGAVVIVSEASRMAAEAARDQAVAAAATVLAGVEDAIETYLLENPPEGGGAVDSVNSKTGVVVLSASDLGLGNVNNTSDANKPISTATQTALNLKAPLASPTFTGSPTVPGYVTTSAQTTALAGKANTGHAHVSSDITDLATFVDGRFESVVGAAPAALNTLDELAAALGDDANFASTVTSSLALKANSADLISRASLGLSRPEIRADSATTCPNRTAWIAANCPGYSGLVLWHTAQYVGHPGPSTAIDGDDWVRRTS